MIFSIAFMFGTISSDWKARYPPPSIDIFLKHEYYRIFFSVAFMFSTIYLRLEGKVPPTPPGLGWWSLYRWRLRLQGPAWWRWFFFYSIHVWFNLPKIGKQGTPQNWTWIWDERSARSMSAFYNLPLPFHHLFYAWKGNLWISISYGHLKIWIFRLGWGIFSTPQLSMSHPKIKRWI